MKQEICRECGHELCLHNETCCYIEDCDCKGYIQVEKSIHRCEKCDNLDGCTCFCNNCGLDHSDCICDDLVEKPQQEEDTKHQESVSVSEMCICGHNKESHWKYVGLGDKEISRACGDMCGCLKFSPDIVTENCNSKKISQQLQELLDGKIPTSHTVITMTYIIQQVKELENDRISLQRQLSKIDNIVEKHNECPDKCGNCKGNISDTCYEDISTNILALKLKLKSDTDTRLKLEEFKKELIHNSNKYLLKHEIIDLADKYFGDKNEH